MRALGLKSKGGALWLTDAELSILRSVLGFVEAGDISGGPLQDESPQQQAANLRVFNRLMEKVHRA